MDLGTAMAVAAPVLGALLATAGGRLLARHRSQPPPPPLPIPVPALPPGSRIVIEIGGSRPPHAHAAGDE